MWDLHHFIYEPDKSIAVYRQAMEYLKDAGKTEDLNLSGRVYETIGELIPHTTENLG